MERLENAVNPKTLDRVFGKPNQQPLGGSRCGQCCGQR